MVKACSSSLCGKVSQPKQLLELEQLGLNRSEFILCLVGTQWQSPFKKGSVTPSAFCHPVCLYSFSYSGRNAECAMALHITCNVLFRKKQNFALKCVLQKQAFLKDNMTEADIALFTWVGHMCEKLFKRWHWWRRMNQTWNNGPAGCLGSCLETSSWNNLHKSEWMLYPCAHIFCCVHICCLPDWL